MASQPQYLISPYPVFTPLLPASQAQTEGVPVAGSGYMGGIMPLSGRGKMIWSLEGNSCHSCKTQALVPALWSCGCGRGFSEVADPQSGGQGSVPGSVGP